MAHLESACLRRHKYITMQEKLILNKFFLTKLCFSVLDIHCYDESTVDKNKNNNDHFLHVCELTISLYIHPNFLCNDMSGYTLFCNLYFGS